MCQAPRGLWDPLSAPHPTEFAPRWLALGLEHTGPRTPGGCARSYQPGPRAPDSAAPPRSRGRLVPASCPGLSDPYVPRCASMSLRCCDCNRKARYLGISKGERGTWRVLALLLSEGSGSLRVHTGHLGC